MISVSAVLFLFLSLDSLRFWTSTIKTFTSDNGRGRAPIILVGTHADMVDESEAKKQFKEVKTCIQIQNINCIAINNAIETEHHHDPEDLEELREMILNCGLGIADEKVPARWIDLNIALDNQRWKGTALMSFADLKKLDETLDVALADDESIKSFLEHLHCRGQLMYFPEDGKSDLILLEPNILVKFLNRLMRTIESKDVDQSTCNNDWINIDGMASNEYIVNVAKEIVPVDEIEHVHKLPGILKRLKIVYECSTNEDDEPIYILPGLLPQFEPEPGTCEQPIEKGPKLKLAFSQSRLDSAVPLGFYHHFLVAILTDLDGATLVEHENKLQIFRTHACVQYRDTAVVIDLFWENDAIFIHINNFSEDVQLTDIGLDDLVKRIETCVRTTMDIYRHTNAAHFLGVECPQHQDCYLDLKKLRQSGKAMCKKRHTVNECAVLPTVNATQCTGENTHEVTIQDLSKDVKLRVAQVGHFPKALLFFDIDELFAFFY